MNSNLKKNEKTRMQPAYAGAVANTLGNSRADELLHIENRNNREDAERLGLHIADINAGRARPFRF